MNRVLTRRGKQQQFMRPLVESKAPMEHTHPEYEAQSDGKYYCWKDGVWTDVTDLLNII